MVSDKRKKKGKKGCKVTERKLTYEEQIEAPIGTVIDIGDF